MYMFCIVMSSLLGLFIYFCIYFVSYILRYKQNQPLAIRCKGITRWASGLARRFHPAPREAWVNYPGNIGELFSATGAQVFDQPGDVLR